MRQPCEVLVVRVLEWGERWTVLNCASPLNIYPCISLRELATAGGSIQGHSMSCPAKTKIYAGKITATIQDCCKGSCHSEC